jgi:hypothetical protein
MATGNTIKSCSEIRLLVNGSAIQTHPNPPQPRFDWIVHPQHLKSSMLHSCISRFSLTSLPKAHPATCLAAVISVAVWLELCAFGAPLQVATFRCDVTSWPGETLIWTAKLVKVEEPLLANDSELSFRKAFAAAAETDPTRVAVQCIHQLAAPYADEGAHRLLDALPSPLPHLSLKFLDAVRGLLAAAAQGAVAHLEPFDQVGTGQAKVERIASAPACCFALRTCIAVSAWGTVSEPCKRYLYCCFWPDGFICA